MATDQEPITLRIGSELFQFAQPQLRALSSSETNNVDPDQTKNREVKLTITVTISLS